MKLPLLVKRLPLFVLTPSSKLFQSFFLSAFLSLFLLGCNSLEKNNYREIFIEVSNPSPFERLNETIEISLNEFGNIEGVALEIIGIEDEKGNQVLSQLLDLNEDKKDDHLVFQTNLKAKATIKYRLIRKEERQDLEQRKKAEKQEKLVKTYCRLVPERIDDFAWENDKVAFRTYGPKCQEMFETGTPGGLISSGIDCWTKRVDYSIIDKWYEGYNKGITYHEDHGEGLDAYHVGTTRGCGGIAIQKNGQYIFSENFKKWKIIANGPIRTIFELEYPPVLYGKDSVIETKRITLDLGSNLFHNEVTYQSKKQVDTIAVGLALHQGKGMVDTDQKKGWVSYWEPMADSEIGTGIIIDHENLIAVHANKELKKDETYNNIWATAKVSGNKFSYWAGFGWKKAKEFETKEAWQNYLKQESIKKKQHVVTKFSN